MNLFLCLLQLFPFLQFFLSIFLVHLFLKLSDIFLNQTFEQDLIKLYSIGISSLQKNLEKNFPSCMGALKIIKDGWETEAIPEIVSKNIKKIGLFTKIFGFCKCIGR